MQWGTLKEKKRKEKKNVEGKNGGDKGEWFRELMVKKNVQYYILAGQVKWGRSSDGLNGYIFGF